MILQLNPYIPLITPVGFAEAFAMSDPKDDDFPIFYCFMDASRTICVFQSTEVRQMHNLTLGRKPIPLEELFDEETLKRWEKRKEFEKKYE